LIRTYVFVHIKAMLTGEPPDRLAIDAVLPDLRKQIGILDNAVANTGYLVDDQFTLADLNLLPILDRVILAPEGAEALTATAHLSRYFEKHAARPSFQRTLPTAGPPERAKTT
jgi:glutathione S-transferase